MLQSNVSSVKAYIYECFMIMLMLCKSSYARLTPEVLHILLEKNRTKAHPLSSIVAPPSLKQILDSNHQNLREKAAKLDWREDPLISKV